MRPLIIFAFVLFSVMGMTAQMQFETKVSKNKLGINERLRVDFTMNQDGDNFTPPDFDDFTVVAGPSQSVSNTWINGVRSFSKTYTYFLMPKRRGKITINQASIEYDGQVYKTIPVPIEVTAAVEIPTDPNDPEYIASQSIHLVAELSKSSPFLNEPITVTYKIYVNSYTNVSGWQVIDSPKFTDFWNQNVDRKHEVQNGTYNGQDYRYLILQETVLYPQKTGILKLEPLSMNVSVEVRTNRRDFFGNYMYKRVNRVFASQELTVNVKPLPEQGKPADFTGAVGTFKMDLSLTKDRVSATESTQAKITVTGQGNLKLFNLPKMDFPEHIEAYEPEHSENVVTKIDGMQGSITDSYTLVPNQKGKYLIPGVTFSYFDPGSRTYKTLRANDLNLKTEAAPAGVVTNAATGNTTSTVKLSVTSLGNQLRYLKRKTELKPVQNKKFFQSASFYASVLGPLLLIPIAMIIGRKQREFVSDQEGNRVRKANKLAKKYLSEAKNNLGNQQSFYESLERAFHNYLKAKLKIETSEFSKEKIEELLLEKQVTSEITANFIGLLKICELARYAPSSEVTMQRDYEKAVGLISTLDKQIK
ncbi:MAG: BatD protein [Flavobacteriales bacterium CG_4_9_14_3_um_filter_40_17]|nr:MAG: BatD protein [Flavobacteriales bacterium CG_4_9_14_3_um_filter_40_17]